MAGSRHRHSAFAGAAILTVGLLSGAALTSTPQLSAAASGGSGNPVGAGAPALNRTGTPGSGGSVPSFKSGPLSPRLQQLARPALATSSAVEQAQAIGLPLSGPGSLIKHGDDVLVDLRVADVSPATQSRLRAAGATITFVDQQTNMITASVAPGELAAVAAVQPEVISVREVPTPESNAACPTGDTVSEGDTMLTAALGRTHHGVDGTGVTVGVISDSYAKTSTVTAATDVLNGELPGATNPCGKLSDVVVQAEGASGNDEGRAMAQIVHDLAPGASIRFATALNGESDFAQQIRDLAAAGAKVIVDDVTYLNEPVYQDGVIGQAVEDVTAAGVTYFSSAGNSNWTLTGNLASTNTNSYETMAYRPTTCPAVITAIDAGYIDCHDFDAGPGVDNTYGATTTTVSNFSLGWNEPQFGVKTDLDLFLINHSTGAVVYNSASDSIASGVATEWLANTTVANLDIVVARFQGASGAGSTPRFKLTDGRAHFTAMEYANPTGTDVAGPTIFGHNASRRGVTVGAVPYSDQNTLETYSSNGPATYCWAGVVGTTAAARLTPCESATVDLVAMDGNQNSFFGSVSNGYHRFFGTSSAAPHAAAVAALIIQKAPCLSPAKVISALKVSAHTIGSFSPNAIGAGRIDADAALSAASCNPFEVRGGAPSATTSAAGRTVAVGSPVTTRPPRAAAPSAASG